MTQRTSSPQILDDGTEVPDDDDFPVPHNELEVAGRWSALYSLEEEEQGYAIVTFDGYGRALRPHPLEAGRYETPAAAFDAIRRWESGVMLRATRAIAREEDGWGGGALTAEAVERSA